MDDVWSKLVSIAPKLFCVQPHGQYLSVDWGPCIVADKAADYWLGRDHVGSAVQ